MNFNATLIGQTITFIVFVWFCMKYIWPPLMAALEERNARISEGLAAAQRGQQDLEDAQSKVHEPLGQTARTLRVSAFVASNAVTLQSDRTLEVELLEFPKQTILREVALIETLNQIAPLRRFWASSSGRLIR